jgi:hypothetical protein
VPDLSAFADRPSTSAQRILAQHHKGIGGSDSGFRNSDSRNGANRKGVQFDERAKGHGAVSPGVGIKPHSGVAQAGAAAGGDGGGGRRSNSKVSLKIAATMVRKPKTPNPKLQTPNPKH